MNNKALYDKSIKSLESINDNQNVDTIYRSLLYGKNTYLRLTRRGSSSIDPHWIEKIEDVLYDLDQIVNKPREETKNESEVTPIELAKKINGESVQHLASHSQFIKEIQDDGNVTPSKILSHYNVENIHTYENRFIATFIRRLVLFIEKRYKFIVDQINMERDEILITKNQSVVNGNIVEIESKITVKKDDNDKSAIDTKKYIERVLKVREYIHYYYNSWFMKELKTDKDVRRPILQTNIIRKNPLYKKCYETFMFIEKFDSLGVSYKLEEKFLDFKEKDLEKLNYLNMLNYLSIQESDEYETLKEVEKKYKPKMLTSIDDEKFIYGDYYKGPIEFVRVDEKYLEYLAHRNVKDLPAHPHKKEKEFYEDEYKAMKDDKKNLEVINSLLNRKRREAQEYEKRILQLIENREKEEALKVQQELEKVLKEEQALLEKQRALIIKEAQAFSKQNKAK